MVLTRKIRRNGSSFVVTIPSDISKMLEFNEDDIISYELDSLTKSIIIKKI